MTIYNEKEMKRIIDFKDFELNNYTPTDIDFVYEKNNKCWIIGEVKEEGVEVPPAQKLLFERWLENHLKLKIPTLYIHAVHNTPPEENINLAELLIEKAIAVYPDYSKGFDIEGNVLWTGEICKSLRGKNAYEVCQRFLLKYKDGY